MRGFEIIAIVIGVFFAIGIAVGMLLVIALPGHAPEPPQPPQVHGRRRQLVEAVAAQ
jgi:hypothetical protein